MHIDISNKSNCCGCTTCAESCSKHCITMLEDDKGFLFPSIDSSMCVDCGLCLSLCPIQGTTTLTKSKHSFAAWTMDENVYNTSTSAGIAYELSRNVIQSGGVVYGCAYDESFHAKHIRVSCLDQLKLLQGSKYVQSDIRDVFKQVKSDLLQNIQVLFISTPCQVSGLKNYLRKDYANLLLVDLVCHGVPSDKMLHDHIRTLTSNRMINHLSFRNSNQYVFTVSSENFVVSKTLFHDAYISAFLNGISCRDSCRKCRFATQMRCSNLTIGDFWGLGQIETTDFVAPEKVSLILVQDDKGLSALSRIECNVVLHERSVEEAIAGNWHLHSSNTKTVSSIIFSFLYPALPFDIAVRLSTIKHTISRCFNKVRRCFFSH